ncbi:MAG TPA: hypothetical protein VGO31_12715 [Microbacteriaceae bacterium]|jgi:hypothetical protein|nr:hypothetical protein [Microbacteriaceae bacterium]
MSDVDQRQQALLGRIDAAVEALNGLLDAERGDAGNGAGTLDRVLSYTRAVVSQTDGELTTDSAIQAIGSHADAIATDPVATAASARAYADAILTGVALLPAARDRDVEQAVRESAANYQRSTSQRLNAIEAAAAEAERLVQADLATLRENVATASTTALAEIEAHATAFEGKLDEVDTTISAQQQRLDVMLDRQNATFASTQEERTAAYEAALAAAKKSVADLLAQAKVDVDARVSEIRRMEEESSGLVASIGLGGTAERYGDEAKDQKRVADTFRWITVVLALGAVAMAIFAVIHRVNDNSVVLAKLGVSAVLGGLAAYTARQSGRHRQREERARNLQLELTAFAPFIEPLPEPIKELERVLMTRKTFGNIAALPDGDDGSHNYGPLGPVLDRVQKRLASGAINDN